MASLLKMGATYGVLYLFFLLVVAAAEANDNNNVLFQQGKLYEYSYSTARHESIGFAKRSHVAHDYAASPFIARKTPCSAMANAARRIRRCPRAE